MSTSFDDFANAHRSEGDTEQQERREALQGRFALAGQLFKLRLDRGLTQVQLAERSGIDQSEISKIERGVKRANEDTLARLTEALDAHLEIVPNETRDRELTGHAGARPALA